jgi:hypothetical protein
MGGDTNAHWIKHLPTKHGVAANHRPAGSPWDPPLDESFNIPLVSGIADFLMSDKNLLRPEIAPRL